MDRAQKPLIKGFGEIGRVERKTACDICGKAPKRVGVSRAYAKNIFQHEVKLSRPSILVVQSLNILARTRLTLTLFGSLLQMSQDVLRSTLPISPRTFIRGLRA